MWKCFVRVPIICSQAQGASFSLTVPEIHLQTGQCQAAAYLSCMQILRLIYLGILHLYASSLHASSSHVLHWEADLACSRGSRLL